MGIEQFGDKVFELRNKGLYAEVKASAAAKLQAALKELSNGGDFSTARDALSGVNDLDIRIKELDEQKQKMIKFFADFADEFEHEFGFRLTVEDLNKIVHELYEEDEKEVKEDGGKDAVITSLPLVDSSVESDAEEAKILGDTELKYLEAYLRLGAARGVSKMSDAVESVFALEIRQGAKPASIYARSMVRKYREELTRELKDVLHALRDTLKVSGFSFSVDKLELANLALNQRILASQLLETYRGKPFSEIIEMLEPKMGNGELKKKKK